MPCSTRAIPPSCDVLRYWIEFTKMDAEYDTIVLGTGLKESILSGLAASNGKKVLHMDRNNYYGGESASLNLQQVFEKFKPGEEVPEQLGRSRDYCIDLCPKFIMANGDLVKMLIQTKVTRYLEFKSVTGSYVFQSDKVYKVPVTPNEAISSSLLGLFQKRRFRNFVTYVNDFDEKNTATWEKQDVRKQTTQEMFEYWKLEKDTQLFTGNALALEADEDYRKKPALQTIKKIKLYAESLARFGNSPYIYPVWGLGGLPEGFSRLSAIYGGVYMLDKKIDEILYNEDGTVKGVRSGEETALCKQLIADPSYFQKTDKVRKTGQVARCIVILDHPIPNTNDADSTQIIIPAAEMKNRTSNLYVSMVSFHHKIAARGKYVAVCACNVEGEKANTSDVKDQNNVARRELRPALTLLGKALSYFFWVSDQYEPTGDGSADNVFITKTYDASTHFSSATEEVLAIAEKVLGKPIDLNIKPDIPEPGEE